ncbi:MAG TPA: type II CAAX endopeptidase family protein [Stellaceae bacterium]|nr:type II CAAX endopeptidase family protein [Stellaceae bacterium]
MKSRLVALFVGAQGLRAGWGILLFAALLGLCTGILLLALPHGISSERALFLTEAMLLAGVAGSTAIMAWVEGRNALSYGLEDPRALRRFVRGAVWGLVLLSMVVALALATGHAAIAWGALDGGSAVAYGVAYALGLTVVALAEEMLLRGYLQVTLARLIGFWPAACVLSLAFGLMHGGNPGESKLGLVSAMLIGGALCLCLRRSGSLWWGIGFHAAWDWAQVFLWGTPVSGFVFEGRLMETQALGDPLWSGGATGPEGSLLILPILALAVIVIVRSFRQSGAVEPA